MAQDEPPGEGGATRAPRLDRWGVDWGAVEHDFLYSGMSQRRIAWRHGTTDNTLRKYAKAGGWERIVAVERMPMRGRGPRDGEPPTPTEERRAGMVRRLYKALDRKLQALEGRMAKANDGSAPESASDTERDIRAITALMQLYAKLAAMDEAARGTGSPTQDGARTDDDADRLRRDLADRLARLAGGNA